MSDRDEESEWAADRIRNLLEDAAGEVSEAQDLARTHAEAARSAAYPVDADPGDLATTLAVGEEGDEEFEVPIGLIPDPVPVSTDAVGEEGDEVEIIEIHPPLPTPGEGDLATTLAVGEEGDEEAEIIDIPVDPTPGRIVEPVDYVRVGDGDDGRVVPVDQATTLAVGEEGEEGDEEFEVPIGLIPDPVPVSTDAVGEEGDEELVFPDPEATTLAVGEEGDEEPIDVSVSTDATGEEGDEELVITDPEATTLAVGEEGDEEPELLEIGDDLMNSTTASGEEGDDEVLIGGGTVVDDPADAATTTADHENGDGDQPIDFGAGEKQMLGRTEPLEPPLPQVEDLDDEVEALVEDAAEVVEVEIAPAEEFAEQAIEDAGVDVAVDDDEFVE